jgi:hypothetical protein
MRREATAVVTAALFVVGQAAPVLGWSRGGGGRGSVSAASRGSWSHSGNTGSWQGRGGYASGSRTVTQTGQGYNVNKSVQTQSGASKSVNKDVNTQDKSVDRSSTATNAWGQSASRDRTVEGQGGYATVEGSAHTSTGREASGQGTVGRNAWGQPAYAGSVNTKYNGSYATAGARNPYGGWTTATAGPYGGRVTTTLPSGYRTTSYYGRPYYSYAGAYYRPYTYGGVHYYYPVPPPYYSYYSSPPVGAVILTVAGVAYLMSKDGSYSKQTTSSEGKVEYQSVPAPQGASLQALPAERVLVTVSGSTYYLYSNAFYRRVVSGTQESFVVVAPPAGVVFVPALPADFQVVQLNTMYFTTGGHYYTPYLSADGKELYVMVDRPPQPPATAAGPSGAAPAPAAGPAPAAAPAVRTVAQSVSVPTGTLLLVRLASALSPATAHVGDRFQGFLDQDLAADGRLVAPRGGRVYGIVGGSGASLSVTLTDVQVGDHVVPVKTQAVSSQKTLAAQSLQAFTVAVPLEVDVMTNVAVR